MGLAFGGLENVGALSELTWDLAWRRTLCVVDHGLWTALVGAGIGLAEISRSRFRIAVPAASLLAAVALHSFHNVMMLQVVYRLTYWASGSPASSARLDLQQGPYFDVITAAVWLLLDAVALTLLGLLARRGSRERQGGPGGERNEQS